MLRSILPFGSAANYESVDATEYETLEHNEASSFDDSHGPKITHDLHVSSPSLDAWSEVGENMSQSDPYHSLIRSVSCEGSVILSHPTPDLQALQGAYISNVERLEQSAERLSLSSDIGEELRKLHREQTRSVSRKTSLALSTRQFSSQGNSIIGFNSVARSGGILPEGSVASQAFSLSPPRSRRSIFEIATGAPVTAMDSATIRSEPEQEGRPLDSPVTSRPNFLTVRNFDETESSEEKEAIDRRPEEHDDRYPDRPGSSGSGDTFRRALNAFADFDGVHIQDGTHDPAFNRQQSPEPIDSGSPSTTRTDIQRPYAAPPTGNNMVFYPAPVPAVLNLPQKLSKAPPTSELAQRKSQMLQMSYPGGHSNNAAKHASQLPPQLRASVFFEHPPIHQDIQLLGGSAVATLDSILDAAAYAPVSAFTDHPIAGQLGADIYNKSTVSEDYASSNRKSRASIQLLRKRKSTSTMLQHRVTRTSFSDTGGMRDEENLGYMDARDQSTLEGDKGEISYGEGPLQSSADRVEEQDAYHDAQEHEIGDEVQDPDETEEDIHTDRPMTLLAELQFRKQQQKQRNRTAATAFPNGMHSTLLQLDAVAQVQKQARKQKHVTLAWEDPSANEAANDDPDEDIPLGVLFPGPKSNLNDMAGRFPEDRPLGLLAQRAMEDNEPLRQRRARLRGEPLSPRFVEPEKKHGIFNLEVRGVTDLDSENIHEEEETLAQRLKRLKGDGIGQKARAISGDFASEILSHFGDLKDEKEKHIDSARKTPDPEETLGQRRRRLQAERQASQEISQEASQRPPMQKRRSMADILQAHPGGLRQVSSGSTPGISSSGLVGNMSNLQSMSRDLHNATNTGPRAGIYTGAYPTGSYVNPMSYTPMMGANAGAAMAPAYPTAAPMAEQMALNAKQRAVIDRWRESVL